MKKIFFSLLAIAAIASCAKTEDVYTPDNSEIKLAPVTSMATKTNVYQVIEGPEYPSAENFNVYAYWANQPAGSSFEDNETLYLDNVTFVNKGRYWGGATTQYWPKNGSLRFAAYSPSTLDMGHDLSADSYTLKDFAYPAEDLQADARGVVTDYTAKTFEVLVTPTTKSYTAQTAAESVSVVFEHTLSWITFEIKSTEVANTVFTVNEVIVNDVNTVGTLDADMKACTKTWSTSEPKAVSVFTGSKYVVENVCQNPVVYEDVEDGLLVLPQETTTVTINFTQNEVGDAPMLEDQTVTIPLTLAGDDPWEAGKHYIYTVIFDLDEILINPSVEEWEEVIVPEINATATEVMNEAELQAALEAGRSVRLADNIELDHAILVGNSVVTKAAEPVDVVLDLNGKSIVSTGESIYVPEKCSALITVVDGANLTIVGDGTVDGSATSDYAVEVRRGGNIIIEGGNYIGSVSAVYASEGFVTINAGTFKDQNSAEFPNTYLLNCADNNYKAETAGIVVEGGKFYDFDPSNNAAEGNGTNFLGKNVGSYELEANVWTVASKTDEIQVNTEAALHDAAYHGANVILGADITVNETVVVEGNLVLNLFDKTITNKEENTATDVFVVKGSLEVNGTGAIAAVSGNDGYAIIADGTVTINDGTITSGVDDDGAPNAVVYARGNGKVYVKGGYFPNENDSMFVLNKKDDSIASAVISVTGGSYVGFNPAANTADGDTTNYVAEGYKSIVTAENTWTVMHE